jgi:hypothetical protein
MSEDVRPVGTRWWRHKEATQEVQLEATLHAIKQQQEPEHVHTFEFLLNNSHTALRGCITCGMTHVGLMAGTVDQLRWHYVEEPDGDE